MHDKKILVYPEACLTNEEIQILNRCFLFFINIYSKIIFMNKVSIRNATLKYPEQLEKMSRNLKY